MSRTLRDRRNSVGIYKSHKGKFGIVGRKINRTERKMTPMLAGKRENYGKFTYADGSDVSFCYKTKAMKLEVKNANRSVKKAERRKAILEAKNEID